MVIFNNSLILIFKIMSTREFLQFLGHTSGDIKQRYNNKQIRISNKPVKNLNRNLNFEYYMTLEEWLNSHDIEFIIKLRDLSILFNNIYEMFYLKTNINSSILKYLKSFILLQIDKKTFYILIKN